MSSYQIQLQILDENGKSQKIYPINTSLDNIVGVIEPSLLLALPGEKEGETLATSLSYIKAYLKNLEDVASVKRSVSSSATLDDARTLATSKAVYTVQQALTTANSEIVNIKNNYAIKNHADTLKTYGIGTSLLYGHVKVSDTYDSQVSGGNAENGVSASQNALYRVYNALITKTNDIVDNFKEHVNTLASNETSGHVAIGDNITVSNGKISLGKENVCGALGYTPIQASDLTQGEGISISGTKITNSGVRSISEGSTNGTISTNINGATKNIVVHGLKSAAYTDADDYADATHYHDSIDQTNDHRTAATTPNDYNGKLKNVGLKESSVIGSPDASTFAGVIGYRGYANSNGGVANEFAFTSLGKLFRRTGATTTWNPWLEMIDSGNISKYAPSLSGSGASGNWNINAATATTLENSRKISLDTGVVSTAKSFDGSSGITIPVTVIKESYLTWGGKNLSNSVSPLDELLVPELGANRFAFMPTEAINIEYSTDAGSSWSTYTLSDVNMSNLFNGLGSELYSIGGSRNTGIVKTDHLLRITITTKVAKIYTSLNKFIIRCMTNGSVGSYCTIEARTQANYESETDAWVTFADKVGISGWTGYNVINTSNITTYGSDMSQFGQLRFTFGVASHTNTSYGGLTIFNIYGFGGMGLTVPSTMAKTGRIYKYDGNQNVIFPAMVTATKFSGATASTSENGLMSYSDKTKLDFTNVAYGICETVGATSEKVVTISGNSKWVLKPGAIIVVKFTNTNTATNVKLNVNNTGAKSIWYNVSVFTNTSIAICGCANRYCTYMYDGTYWVWISGGYNVSYSNASLGQGYGACATEEATVAKVVNLSDYTLITGGTVAVKFTYGVPAGATMNINNKGAKAIYYKGAAITAGIINAGDTAHFIYNGSYYHLLSIDSVIDRNASAATKLATARTINGTSFDGTSNITTSLWGTARNIYISDSDATNTGAAVSVNGGANATLKLPSTIKASLTGNASTATTLATARTINGTSFNGSANITTTNWGTARNFYISDSDATNTGAAVSVNGSGNVTLKLPATIKASLTGNASTATKLGTSNVGNGARPIYLNAGAATASSSTVGSADTPIYMNGGTLTSTGKKFSDYLPLTGGTITGLTTFNKGINLPNSLWNRCGDDVYFGDFNAAGCMAFKSTTSSLTGIALVGATSPNMYGRLLVANDGSDMYLTTNRNFYISNGTNSARAPIYASSFIQQSSGRIKTNIVDLSEEEAKKVLDLRPVSYDYISEVEQKGCTGLIAEEVAKILPNTVIGNVDCSDNDIEEIKKIGIDYSKFVPYLIKLIQIQEKRIVELEKNLVQ